MNFGKIFDHKKADSSSKNLEEIYKIKEEIEKEDKIFENELPAKYDLLQKFGMSDLKTLCNELLGSDPVAEEYDDPKSGNRKTLPQYKEDFIHFIIDELRLSEIKEHAIKNKIVSDELK
ncbi:MAG: hypothetical protein WBF38_09030 [Nitrosotalea sp.]